MILRKVLISLAFFAVSACSTEEDKDYPSRNKPPQAASEQENQSDLYDPLRDPNQMGPEQPVNPIPGSDPYNQSPGSPQNPGSPRNPQSGYGDWTNPGGNPNDDNSNESEYGDAYGDWSQPGPSQPNYPAPTPAQPGPPPPSAPGFAGQLPFFVVMGGYKSCQHPFDAPGPIDLSLFTAFHALRVEMRQQTGYDIPYVMSCYEDKNPVVRFTTSAAPGQVITAEESDLASVIKPLVNPGTPVVFIGHSYGGWLAMKTIAAMGMQQRVATLFTLDPISANECSRPFMPGCRRAPTDFGAEQLEMIAASTGEWINMYQRITPYLMSDKIPYADVNECRFLKHGQMDTDPKVWAVIRGKLIGTQIRSHGR